MGIRFLILFPLSRAAWVVMVSAGLNYLALPASAQPSSAAAYTWTTFAGYSVPRGNDGVGTQARFNNPGGIATDSNGNTYVVDTGNYTIRRISAAGLVSTIAGSPGERGFSYGGVNGGARFYSPSHITVDHNGNVFVADQKPPSNPFKGYDDEYVILKIAPIGTNWVVTLIAASEDDDYLGAKRLPDYGDRIRKAGGLAADTAGSIYLAESGAIRKISLVGTDWKVSTVANSTGYTVNRAVPPTKTNFVTQCSVGAGIAIDGTGSLYVADQSGSTISKLTLAGTNWVCTTIAGLSGSAGSADGVGANARFQNASGIAADHLGNLYVADGGRTVRALRPQGTNWLVSTLAGSPGSIGSSNASGTNALFNGIFGVAVDRQANLIVSDSGNNLVRQVTSAGAVKTIAGRVEITLSAGSVDGVGSEARFNRPGGLALDRFGNLYVADSGNSTIRVITPAGSISTIAGSVLNPGTNDGVGSDARFMSPGRMAVDSTGNLYVADSGAVRRITPAGAASTIPGVTANDVVVDSADNVLILSGDTVQRISPAGTSWVASSVATVPMDFSFGGLAFAVASDGRLVFFVPGYGKLNPQGADQVFQLAPDGTNWLATMIPGVSGKPQCIAVDGAGKLYLGSNLYSTPDDESGSDFVVGPTVQTITPVGSNWLVSTIGGSSAVTRVPRATASSIGRANVDGVGLVARFDQPKAVAVDSAGNVYVADVGNNNIRKGTFTAYAPADPVAYTPPPTTGQLTVTLAPTNASGQWRFPWEFGWHNSGVTVSNLAAGNYPVEFRTALGWLTIPSSQPVSVTNGGTVSIMKECYPTLTGEGANGIAGSLTVDFGPASPSGAGWRFLGENTPYFTNVFTTNLASAAYLIEFAFVSGRVKPSSQAVHVRAGLPSVVSVNYPLAPPPPTGVYLPFPVPSIASQPFGFNGQLQSDNGYGSGVAVDTHVVLTAGHLVFDDTTLSYVGEVHWFFRRDLGVSEPLPQAARSFFVLSGYAARRTNDYPVQSTAQSRNLDVAALYFPDEVAGGGHGGYLPSDAVPNTWLTGTASKMLVGYPVDGSQFGDPSIVPGKMYQTDPQPYPLSLSRDAVEGRQEVYVAPWFLSYPGNSGGPLYVELNSSYYPAGVYLGTLFDGNTPTASAVRAIDSTVVNLITNAAALGASGTNNTGGGVITLIPSQGTSGKNPGYISFRLGPPAAVTAGVGWRLQGDTVYASATNYTRAITSTNAITVEFKPIPGWTSPTNVFVMILPGQLTTFDATYTVEPHPPRLSATRNSGTIELRLAEVMGGWAYQIERRPSLTAGAWETVSVLSNSYNLVLPKPTTNEATMFYRARWLP